MSNPPPVYRDIVLVHVDAKTKEKTDVPFRVFERWVPRQRLVVLAVCPHPKDVKKYPSYIAAAKHRDRAERSDADVPLDKLLEGQVCVCALFVRKNAGIPEEKRRWGYYTPFNEAADKGRKVPLPGEYHIEWVREYIARRRSDGQLAHTARIRSDPARGCRLVPRRGAVALLQHQYAVGGP